MPNLNKVFLMGNLTADPELRYVPNGSALAKLRMAVNRTYKTQAGEMKDEVLFINVTTWGKTAEACSERLRKGSPVFVEGRLQSRTWETDAGEKRSAIEVQAERVQFLDRAPGGGGGRSGGGAPGTEESVAAEPVAGADSDVPF